MPKTIIKTLASQAAPESIRKEDFQGVEHLVIPVIALVEGVLMAANADVPAFVSAEEFLVPLEAWNGKPVLVNHPKWNGDYVSANSPEVFENEVIGFTFNASVVDDKKLKVEAWINLEKVKELDGITEDTINQILAGEEIEISTGYFADEIEREGFYNGEKFEVIQEHIVPDHLALLESGVVGACSWEDGCGAARMNQGDKKMSDLELCPNCNCLDGKEKLGFYKSALKSFSKLLSFKDELSDMDKRQALMAAIAAKGEEFFYVVAVFDTTVVYERDWTTLVRRTYSIEKDGSVSLGEDEVFVRPVTSFVPIQVNEEEKDKRSEKEGIEITTTDTVIVEGVTIINPNQDKTAMDISKADLIKGILAHEGASFAESDQEWLESMTEEQLVIINDSLVHNTKHDDDDEEEEEKKRKENEEKEKEKKIAAKQNEGVVSVEQYINQAPVEIREVLNSGIRMQQEKKDALIKSLMNNSLNQFSQEDLSRMSLDNLEKINSLADKPDYSGQAGSQSLANQDDPNAIPPAPLVYDFSKPRGQQKTG